ncbi:hypothetical protein PCE1_004727 [Barthelona sp. PCE]
MMNLRHFQTIMQVQQQVRPLQSIAFSPNGLRTAVLTSDRMIHLFDETGAWREKFGLRPVDGKIEPQIPFAPSNLSFSPDNTRLAVAQTDNGAVVYRLGNEWGEKKAIVAKFKVDSPVLSFMWPEEHGGSSEIVFMGLEDGSIQLCSCSNPSQKQVYKYDCACIHLAYSQHNLIAAFTDGSVHQFVFNDEGSSASHTLIANIDSPIVHIGISGDDVVVIAGNGVTWLGKKVLEFDEEIICGYVDKGVVAVCLSSTLIVMFGDGQTRELNLQATRPVNVHIRENKVYVMGTFCNLEVFEFFLMKKRFDDFEILKISSNALILKFLTGEHQGQRLSLALTSEMNHFRLLKKRFLIIETEASLIIADLAERQISELNIRMASRTSPKFLFFEEQGACVVFHAGECHLVVLGESEILATYPASRISASSVSLSLKAEQIAYLIDAETLQIYNYGAGAQATISHPIAIDWIELNHMGNYILFRDVLQKLYVVELKSLSALLMSEPEKVPLLDHCEYCQWVPQSNVVVAQSRNLLKVWYNIESPSKSTNFEIGGVVQSIERGNGKTEVIVLENNDIVGYILDEALIEFDMAIAAGDLGRASIFLEDLLLTPEITQMWSLIAKLALDQGEFQTAKNAYTMQKNVVNANFCQKIIDHVSKLQNMAGSREIALNHESTKKLVGLLRGTISGEDLLSKSYNDDDGMLGDTKVEEGDFPSAINHFIRGGLPARAANLIIEKQLSLPGQMTTLVVQKLVASSLYEAAGRLFEFLGNTDQAIQNYVQGKRYVDALRLVSEMDRTERTEKLIRKLKLKQADILLHQGDLTGAARFFLEGGDLEKAIDAFVEAEAWSKVFDLLERIDAADRVLYASRVGALLQSNGKVDVAERLYTRFGMDEELTFMYLERGQFDKVNYDHKDIIISKSQELIAQQRLSEAERLLLRVSEFDRIIAMYFKVQNFGKVVSLVQKHRPDLKASINVKIAKILASQRKFKAMTKHYVLAGAEHWKEAVKILCAENLWSDAISVAGRFNGELKSYIALRWARSIGGFDGAKMLVSYGLIDSAIMFLVEEGEWMQAFDVCANNMPTQLPELRERYAQSLSEEGKYDEAEKYFKMAGKIEKAVDMYIQMGDLEKALLVADKDKNARHTVLRHMADAKVEVDKQEAADMYAEIGDHAKAVELYRKLGQMELANDLARRFVPSMVQHAHKEEIVEVEIKTVKTESKTSPREQVASLCRFGNYEQALRKAQQTDLVSYYLELRIPEFQNDEPGLIELFYTHARDITNIKFDFESLLKNQIAECRNWEAFRSIAIFAPLEERLKMAFYYFGQAQLVTSFNHTHLACQCWLSCVFFLDILPPEVVLYEAGSFCRRLGHNGSAFSLLNLLIDYIEAVEADDIDILDFGDFEEYGIAEITKLPRSVTYDEDSISDIRQWVIEFSTRVNISDGLTMMKCFNCSVDNWQAAHKCIECDEEFTQCGISGAPISKEDTILCPSCNMKAGLQAWNLYTSDFQQCPRCLAPAAPFY